MSFFFFCPFCNLYCQILNMLDIPLNIPDIITDNTGEQSDAYPVINGGKYSLNGPMIKYTNKNIHSVLL